MEPLSGYAVIPDQTTEPVAVFLDLRDALAWALRAIGSDRFRIRGVHVLTAPPQRPAA
jgi:hypothetical protein